jgi:Polyketide cyclase / dehydrase and lipid transport
MTRFLTIVGAAIVLLIAALLVAPAFMPKAAHVERSIVINAPQREVFAYAADLNNFRRWDPGLKVDPKSQVEVRGSGVGAEYAWKSEKNGRGKVTITSLEPPDAIRGRLQFFEPFEDTAQIGWVFKSEGAGTKVTTTFDQEYAYSQRFLSLLMDRVLGPQYEQALAGLKADLEAAPRPTQ